MSGEEATIMVGITRVGDRMHAVIRASENPDCADKDKGKLFLRCNPSVRAWREPLTGHVTCGNCPRILDAQPSDTEGEG